MANPPLPGPPALGPAAPRAARPLPRLPWSLRLRDALSAYLPIVLMALLALATLWLVKNTPIGSAPSTPAAPKHEPDYVMERFTLQRFGADGRLAVQIEGDVLRHYPDDDTLEIDAARIQAYGLDGAVTHATARRALANGDGSEVQLLGGAHVRSVGGAAGGEPVTFDGEFLHAFLNTERLRSHLPVVIRQGTSEIDAAGVEYDNLARTVQLKGPTRARFAPPARR